jgi:ABC-type antimicrobial peptide transport system permease subunit
MSYLVTQRTREIGIPIALGAGSVNALALVVRRGAMLALAGSAIGAAALAAVALVASYIPARRARSLDPSSALRAE